MYVQKDKMTYIAKTSAEKETAKEVIVNKKNVDHLSEMVTGLFA